MDDEQKSTVDDTMQGGSGKGKEAGNKLTNATKKGWKKIKSIKKLAPLVSIISSIAIALVIILLVIGFIGFFITLPGLAMDKFIGGCKGFWNWFTGSEEIEIDKQQIIELGEYIENLGYDLLGNGFVTRENLEKDSETGKIIDINYEEDENNRSYLYAYILQNERIYTTRQTKVSGINKIFQLVLPVPPECVVKVENVLRNMKLYNVGAENYGMLVLDDAEVDKGSAMQGDFKVNIDRDKMVMKITKEGWTNHQYEWDLDGWTGRYGKPIELSLALHLSTMAPDFAYNFCMDKDLQTEVYLATHPITYNASYKYVKNLSDGTKKEIFRDDQKDENGNVIEEGVITKYESYIDTSTVLSFTTGLSTEDAKLTEDVNKKEQLPIGVLDDVNIVKYNNDYYRVIDKDGRPLRVIDSNGQGILYKATVQTDKIVFEPIDKAYYDEVISSGKDEFVGSLFQNSEINRNYIDGLDGEEINLYTLCLNEGIELLNRVPNWSEGDNGIRIFS